MITKTTDGQRLPYSSDFLNQLYGDLRQLANDREKSGGTSGEAERLLRAADVVKRICLENEQGDE